MIDITDKKFWDKVNALAATAEATVKAMFTKVDNQPLTKDEAESCLDALLAYSHLRIMKEGGLKKVYPTTQFTKNRLLTTENLWWTDHYTGGVSELSTLNWFSAMKIKDEKAGKLKSPGASTHFVLGRHGFPYYIIPIWHGAWHEPARNADSLSIELVNPGALTRTADGWKRAQGTLPADMVSETPPVSITPPYRGAKALMPFTTEQIINLIKLKRIVLTLVKPRLVPERMTQHSVWRETKIDMGPMFPLIDVNRAAFEFVPIDQYDFIHRLMSSLPPTATAAALPVEDADDSQSPEYGLNTPTHDDDVDTQPKILSILEVQKILAGSGLYRGSLDGVFGPKTKQAVSAFQDKWNRKAPADKKLDIDGIPGPKTCQALQTP